MSQAKKVYFIENTPESTVWVKEIKDGKPDSSWKKQ